MPSGRPLEFAGEQEESRQLDKKVRSYHVKTKSLSQVDQNASSCSSRAVNGFIGAGSISMPSQ